MVLIIKHLDVDEIMAIKDFLRVYNLMHNVRSFLVDLEAGERINRPQQKCGSQVL